MAGHEGQGHLEARLIRAPAVACDRHASAMVAVRETIPRRSARYQRSVNQKFSIDCRPAALRRRCIRPALHCTPDLPIYNARTDGRSTGHLSRALTSQHIKRGVSRWRRFGRDISIFDCYLRAQTGLMACGHDPRSAVRHCHPRQDDNQLRDAG